VVIVPLGVALTSPLLAYRSAVYALAGFAGVFAMTLLLIQADIYQALENFAGADCIAGVVWHCWSALLRMWLASG